MLKMARYNKKPNTILYLQETNNDCYSRYHARSIDKAKFFFFNEEEALQELLRGYILNQIAKLQQEVAKVEEKYGLYFKQFEAYLHERSALLSGNSLSTMQRQRLGQAVMQEEDDWLDWKVTQDMLVSWLELQVEVQV